MRIVFVGSGGVGGYFGARLAAAGCDVTFIARGRHLAAMREEGLQVLSPLGDLRLGQVQATDDPGSVAAPDLVVIAVKLWSTAEAVESARPLVGGATAVMSLQNGIEAEELLSREFGREHVLGGVAHIAALIERPGVIRHNGTLQRLTFGELDGRASARTGRLAEACRAAGIETVLSQDVRRAIWEKFVFLSAFSGVTAAARLPIGPLREEPLTRELFLEAMREAVAVGRAQGVALDADTAQRQLEFADGLPADMVASMLGDLERGNRLEVPWLSGAVARLGDEHGIATPASRFLYAVLKPHAAGRTAG